MKRRKTVVAKKATLKKSKAKNKVKPKIKSKLKNAPAKKAVKKAAKPATKKVTVKKTVTKKSGAKKANTKKSLKKVPKAVVKKTNTAKPVKKVTAVKPAVQKIDYTKAITPLGDRLVIRLTQVERVTPGGLILPDSVSSTSGFLKGEVLAAGHGTYTKKGHHQLLDVKVGDVVLFSEYSSTKVKFNNEDLHIVHENEILGVTE